MILEDIRNKSYPIEKLGIGGEIDCSKQLMVQTGLTKPKAKALLSKAKEVIRDMI